MLSLIPSSKKWVPPFLTIFLQNGQKSQNFDTGCENFKSNRKRDYIANNTYELIILFVFSATPSSWPLWPLFFYLSVYIYIDIYIFIETLGMQNTNQLSVLAASWDRNLSHNLAKRRVWLRYWSWALILLLRSVPTSMFILCGTNSVNKFQQNCITIHRTRASRVNTSLWHKTYSLAYGGLFHPPFGPIVFAITSVIRPKGVKNWQMDQPFSSFKLPVQASTWGEIIKEPLVIVLREILKLCT